jgi:RNase H-fold protein (predicted Holliday junction resolvase)
MDQSNNQSSDQAVSLSRSSSYGGSDMSAYLQQYNILRDQLLALENEITEIKNKKAQDRITIDQLIAGLTAVQDTDERKKICNLIQPFATAISNHSIQLTALYDESHRSREALDALWARANKRKRRLHSSIPSHSFSPTSFKPYSKNVSYPIFFVDSMLYD